MTEFEDAYYSIVSPSKTPSTTSCMYRILPAAHSFRPSPLPITTCSLRRLSSDHVHRFELVASAVPPLDYCSNCVDCLRSMSTASAIHPSLIYSTSISGSPLHHLGPMAEVSSSHPSPFQLHVSIAALCRLSSEYVHRCKNSLFARDPSSVFVGGETQQRSLRSTIQSMSTVFGVCPWTRNLILYHSLRCHYLVVVHLDCVGSMSTSEMSVYLMGVMQGRILDGNDMLRRLGLDL